MYTISIHNQSYVKFCHPKPQWAYDQANSLEYQLDNHKSTQSIERLQYNVPLLETVDFVLT
jgi:hypothetical protein